MLRPAFVFAWWLCAWGSPLAQAAPSAVEVGLQAARMEFGRTGRGATEEMLAGGWRASCASGWQPACLRSSWLEGNLPSLALAETRLSPSCEAGDAAACLIVGWSVERKADPSADAEGWLRAVRLYKQACDAGLDDGCSDLARMVLVGHGVESNPAFAQSRWKVSCDRGHAPSCTALAQEATSFNLTAANRQTLAEKACKAEDLDGCALAMPSASPAELSELCYRGHRTSCRAAADALSTPEADPTLRRAALEHGCILRDGASCAALARDFQEAGQAADALGVATTACTLGAPEGCTVVAQLYRAGQVGGTLGTYLPAFNEACAAGDPGACTTLGLWLLDQEGENRDPKRARSLLVSACPTGGGDAAACNALGRIYQAGLGVERDRTIAADYYELACAADHGPSCWERGFLLVEGVGVRRDDEAAYQSLSRGCELMVASACTLAGTLLDEATYLPRDVSLAYDHYQRGCNLEDAQACLKAGLLAVERDEPDAARSFLGRAVEAGLIPAYRPLARLYWQGQGGARRSGEAKRLCSEACMNGDPPACRGPRAL